MSQTITQFNRLVPPNVYGEEVAVYFPLSGGLHKVKWSRDRVIYFTLATTQWVDASLGPVGSCRRQALTCTDPWSVPAGLFWVTWTDKHIDLSGLMENSKSNRFKINLT